MRFALTIRIQSRDMRSLCEDTTRCTVNNGITIYTAPRNSLGSQKDHLCSFLLFPFVQVAAFIVAANGHTLRKHSRASIFSLQLSFLDPICQDQCMAHCFSITDLFFDLLTRCLCGFHVVLCKMLIPSV